MQQSPPSRTGLILATVVILGLTAGLGLGLLLGWVIMPVKYVDTAISDLAPEYKDEYIVLVAKAYTLDGDLEKTQARLARLDVPNINQSLSALIARYISEGQDEADIQALAGLAHALGVTNPQMVAYLATPTPTPTNTPLPTPTPIPSDTPTVTPIIPTDTHTPAPRPTDTHTPAPQPTNTHTPAPQPTNTHTPAPQPTDTPQPQPTNTRRPRPTNTPQPTNPPAPGWSWTARLVGPGEDAQTCESGNLQIRVMVVNAGGSQMGGVWLHDFYSNQYQVTGNVDSPDFGSGEAKFEYGIGGGGRICVASGQGGACVSDYTRDLTCYAAPTVEDLFAAGYCDKCCEPGATLERCRQLVNEGKCMGAGHYSWRVVFKRSY